METETNENNFTNLELMHLYFYDKLKHEVGIKNKDELIDRFINVNENNEENTQIFAELYNLCCNKFRDYMGRIDGVNPPKKYEFRNIHELKDARKEAKVKLNGLPTKLQFENNKNELKEWFIKVDKRLENLETKQRKLEKIRNKANNIRKNILKNQNGGYLNTKCNGPWCSIPIKPNVSNMINNNLKSANPPQEALTQYPGTDRLGNNSMSMPGVNQYIGTNLNNGPFNIKCTGQQGGYYSNIYCPKSNKNVSIFSKNGQLAIKNYINKLN